MARASFAYVIFYAAIAAYAPFLQPYYLSLGISLGDIGALVALTSCVALIGSPIWGALHDRFPSSRLLIPVAAVIASAGGMGLGSVGATPLLAVCAAGWALGMSGIGPMMDVRVLDMLGSDRTRYARVRVWGSISFMILTPAIGFLLHQHYQGMFAFMIPGILGGGLASVLLPGRSPEKRGVSLMRAPGRVLRHRPIALYLLAALVGWIAISAQNPFFSIYLGQLGGSSDQVGWAWSLQSSMEIPTMFFFPLLARRVGTGRLIVVGMFILFVRMAANVAFTNPNVLVGFCLLQGVGYGLLLIGGITFVSQQAPRGTAATAQGILNAVTFSTSSIIGAGLGGQVAGLLSIRALYAIAACLAAIAIGLLALTVLPVAAKAPAEIPPAGPPGSPAPVPPAATTPVLPDRVAAPDEA